MRTMKCAKWSQPILRPCDSSNSLVSSTNQQQEKIKPEPEVGGKCELLNNYPEVWWKVVQKCASPSKKELILIIVINHPRAPLRIFVQRRFINRRVFNLVWLLVVRRKVWSSTPAGSTVSIINKLLLVVYSRIVNLLKLFFSVRRRRRHRRLFVKFNREFGLMCVGIFVPQCEQVGRWEVCLVVDFLFGLNLQLTERLPLQ